ncbi:putative Muscarinic acetylcholine receptor M3 [Hypsibius exemplaris]|uniref:Muscarinic acetylcholine receptor M3 n=1 Tax=Hypsibius exemplaris TaxID=2072580 RepID=A0A9X6NGG6_HYPEX|nr:putative Muscarinic acetylcholine receptor M3 [Hypsibius exemplaris]
MGNVSSNENATISPDEKLLQTPHTSWAIITLLIIICLTTILANFTVLASFILEPRLREPFSYLLLNLAVADMEIGLMGMSNLIVYTYFHYWPLGYRYCTVWMYFDWLGVDASLATLSVIAMDRLWAATLPLSYRRYNTTRKAQILIGLIWVVVHAGLLPGWIYDRLYHGSYYGTYDCYWDFNGPTVWAGPLYVVWLTQGLPFAIVLVCYAGTTITLQKLSRGRAHLEEPARAVQYVNSTAPVAERRWRKERQAFILLTLLVVALVLAWTPWFVYCALSTYRGLDNWLMFMVTYWIAYFQSTVNPFLFNICNPALRQTATRMLRGVWIGRSSAVVAPSSLQQGESAVTRRERGHG